MANEFWYCVSLSIVHPHADPREISNAICSLRPRIETMAGSERSVNGGKLAIPPRKALLSHWLADLSTEEKLFSGDKPLSDFIHEQLQTLQGYRDLFGQLRQEGKVTLVVGWFSESNHSAAELDAVTLRDCGELGLDIELDFYAPSNS